VFLTYPFVDEVVGRDPQVARNLHMGDYTNLSVRLDLNITAGNEVAGACMKLSDVKEQIGSSPLPLDEIIEQLDDLGNLCEGAEEVVTTCLSKSDPARIASCLENNLGANVEQLADGTIDTVCNLLGLPCATDDGSGGGGGDGGSGDGGVLDGTLGDLGLGRAGFGARGPDTGPGAGPASGRGPTVGQMMKAYDPALVSLLVPGVVLR
jgi:phospholipid/cholesterol/gamma-HCH transport system substrate-binding protein